MLLAQAAEIGRAADAAIKSSADYGLVGVLFVLLLLSLGLALLLMARFIAPIIRDGMASTISLHNSLKETNMKLAVTLDAVTNDHGDKLSDIRKIVSAHNCQYHSSVVQAQPIQ